VGGVRSRETKKKEGRNRFTQGRGREYADGRGKNKGPKCKMSLGVKTGGAVTRHLKKGGTSTGVGSVDVPKGSNRGARHKWGPQGVI